MIDEKEIKEEMHQREMPDSVELVFGTPSKGTQVKVKTYTNDLNREEINTKLTNMRHKIAQLKKDGFIE